MWSYYTHLAHPFINGNILTISYMYNSFLHLFFRILYFSISYHSIIITIYIMFKCHYSDVSVECLWWWMCWSCSSFQFMLFYGLANNSILCFWFSSLMIPFLPSCMIQTLNHNKTLSCNKRYLLRGLHYVRQYIIK